MVHIPCTPKDSHEHQARPGSTYMLPMWLRRCQRASRALETFSDPPACRTALQHAEQCSRSLFSGFPYAW